MASSVSLKTRALRFTGFFGLQRSTSRPAGDGGAGGHGRTHGRAVPAYLHAGPWGQGPGHGLMQAMDNLLSALYSFPGGYLSDSIGTKKTLQSICFRGLSLHTGKEPAETAAPDESGHEEPAGE